MELGRERRHGHGRADQVGQRLQPRVLDLIHGGSTCATGQASSTMLAAVPRRRNVGAVRHNACARAHTRWLARMIKPKMAERPWASTKAATCSDESDACARMLAMSSAAAMP